jgi:hypothetical protein
MGTKLRVLLAIGPALLVLLSVAEVLPAPGGMGCRYASPAAVFALSAGLLIGLGLYPLAAFVVFAHTLLGPEAAWVRSRRMRLAGVLALGLIITLAGYGAARVLDGAMCRWHAGRIPSRARPVVAALQEYSRSHGEYPAALSELVPEHLAAIPTPGVLGSGGWSYERPSNRPEVGDSPGTGSLFDLSVLIEAEGKWPEDPPHTSCASLHYRPSGHVGDLGRRCEFVEHIGDWVYVWR